MTCGNDLAHSGYRHLVDKDEAGGSSPPRPTTSPDQRKCWPGCLEFAWRGVCRITNSYLVTVARHEPGGHEPPGCPRNRTSGCEPPAFALVYLPLCSCRSAKVCRTALGHAQQPPPPCPPGCGSEHQVVDLMKRWPSSGPMGSRRSTKHCSPHMVQGGSSAGHCGAAEGAKESCWA